MLVESRVVAENSDFFGGALTGVPEYWVADIKHERIIAYSDVENDTYCTVRRFARGETITPQLLPDCPIPVDILLP